MKISVITLFPQMFSGPFDYSIIKNAIDKNKVEINFIDIRNFGLGKHKTVDDKPYGGGIGMVLKVDVIAKAISSAREKGVRKGEEKVILTSAKGETYSQKKARQYSQLKHLIIICGHYEGVDERVKNYIDHEVSIGDFVLTGGEIPAMLIIDSIARLIPGVLKHTATESESFSDPYTLEYPQYTRPENFEEHNVPSVLLSGNHKEIENWKNTNSKKVKRGKS
jgi:tRNA (guanine37-N1)-methyltransferase